MEFFDAVKLYGPYVVLAVMGALIVWSNSRSNEQQSKNMGAVIELSGKLVSNSDRVTDAIERFADDTEKHLKKWGLSVAKNLENAASAAEESRCQHNEQVNSQITNIIVTLESLANQMNGIATKEDLAALNGTPEMLQQISDTLREIKTVLMGNQSGVPERT